MHRLLYNAAKQVPLGWLCGCSRPRKPSVSTDSARAISREQSYDLLSSSDRDTSKADHDAEITGCRQAYRVFCSLIWLVLYVLPPAGATFLLGGDDLRVTCATVLMVMFAARSTKSELLTIKQEIASFSRETHAGTLARWHETS